MDTRFERIYNQIDLIHILLPSGDEERINQEYNKLFAIDKEIFNGEYRTPDEFVVLFDMLSVIAENHIRLGKTPELAVYGIQWMQTFDDFMENAPFSEAEKYPVKEAYFKLQTLLRNHMQRILKGDDGIQQELQRHNEPNVRQPGCKCLLCRKNTADKTGSHMVPELLLEPIFNYNNRKGRGYEAVERFTLDKEERYEYFGQGIQPEEREKEINRSLSEEEKDEARLHHNPFMFDYFFCSECERRFSVIESWYADIRNGKGGEYPPMIPLLFWMSVVWRMSISSMSICLDARQQEKYRQTLDKALALNKADIKTTPSAGGHTAYSLHRVTDMKDETPSLIGAPVPMVPTTIVLGDLILAFFHSKDKALKMLKKGFKAAEDLNTGAAPEKIGECSFIEFWLTRRRLLDMNWEYNGSDSPYMPNGIAQFIHKRNFEMEHLSSTGEMADFSNVPPAQQEEGVYRLTMPYSIFRIHQFMEAHPDGTTPEEFQEELGYTPEEVSIMMSYWDHMNRHLEP